MLVLAHTNGAELPPTEQRAVVWAKYNQAFCEGQVLQVNMAEWDTNFLFSTSILSILFSEIFPRQPLYQDKQITIAKFSKIPEQLMQKYLITQNKLIGNSTKNGKKKNSI